MLYSSSFFLRINAALLQIYDCVALVNLNVLVTGRAGEFEFNKVNAIS